MAHKYSDNCTCYDCNRTFMMEMERALFRELKAKKKLRK